ncbi:MAG: DNA repair protein RecO [Lachnospiraceae bacterium]|nr:DNA repair protein RecO [Lachnospiraceae bacterium]
MSEYAEYTGMIIRTSPVGEYNKRLVILTAEAGKITAFARGARKVGNRFMGTTEPFCFGKFKLLEGKDAYSLTDADISRHFEELRTDYDATVMASYFLEVADYYTRENMEAYEELNLIYASILALISGKFDFKLIRSIYEIKSLVIAGEFPGIPTDRKYSETASYTVERIVNSSVHELFTFTVSDEVIGELEHMCGKLMKNMVDRKFNSVRLM